jgi:3D (Asp-Asp-Asp) domain-containing protein
LDKREIFQLGLLASTAILLGACGTSRSLPQYEAPLAKTDFQSVRTTAYTHTESDHLDYGNHNALGGTLQAAIRPSRSASAVPRALPVYESGDVAPQPFISGGRTARAPTPAGVWSSPTVFGSAAADWSRWPAGTIFRLLSTGEIYKVDDYGWALAGRNTIDLYMATRSDMNSWGTRAEPIQILQWGDPQESLRLLQSHQNYRHLKRMVLELEGEERAAARMR